VDVEGKQNSSFNAFNAFNVRMEVRKRSGGDGKYNTTLFATTLFIRFDEVPM
jgi:uncharacterized protein YcgI (DUF1989 family)